MMARPPAGYLYPEPEGIRPEIIGRSEFMRRARLLVQDGASSLATLASLSLERLEGERP